MKLVYNLCHNKVAIHTSEVAKMSVMNFVLTSTQIMVQYLGKTTWCEKQDQQKRQLHICGQ